MCFPMLVFDSLSFFPSLLWSLFFPLFLPFPLILLLSKSAFLGLAPPIRWMRTPHCQYPHPYPCSGVTCYIQCGSQNGPDRGSMNMKERWTHSYLTAQKTWGQVDWVPDVETVALVSSVCTTHSWTGRQCYCLKLNKETRLAQVWRSGFSREQS